MPNPTLIHPITFDSKTTPVAVAMSAAGVEGILHVFEQQMAEGLHPGGQLVVLRRGQVVVDHAAGLAHVGRRLPARPHTPFLVFSATKAFTALCVHRLIEEGAVEWDAPIARYWPEFGCKGKESATIRHALLHQAGIPARGIVRQIPLWPHWRLVTRNVARSRAEFPPGSQTAYHLVNFGFILGEVVRRVTGQPFEDYLRQTFIEPLGLQQTSMGLPRQELRRSAHVYGASRREKTSAFLFNRPCIRGAIMPAATLHSTARDLAVFYQMLLNGGAYAGRRYLQPETIAAATTMVYEGVDGSGGRIRRWAYGFHLGGVIAPADLPGRGMGRRSTARTFGHFGQYSSMAWADPDAQLVVAFTCNRIVSRDVSIVRWRRISNAVWDALLD